MSGGSLQGKSKNSYNILGITDKQEVLKMTKIIETKSMFGTKATITFEDNFEYIYWGNKVTEEYKLDKLPKTDVAYKVLNDFKGATSVMAMSNNNYKHCVIYRRKSSRCKTWSASFCKLS